MNKTKVSAYFRSVYGEYKIIIVPFIFLILLVAIAYPAELLTALTHLKSSILVTIIGYDTLIVFPLVTLAVLIIIKILKYHDLEITSVINNILILIIFTFIITVLTDTIGTGANPADLILWSTTFMKADSVIFGTYPAFWLYYHIPLLMQVIITYVYEDFYMIISLWLLFLFIYKKGMYSKKFILQFFMAFAICLPLWMIFPSISPAQMYLGNILHQPVDPLISKIISKGPPNSFTDRHVNALFRQWTDQKSKFFATSNFPSMHTIWGILLVYSVAEVFRRKYLTILATLLALANVLGAIYLLPHYGVDILAGIAIAIIVVKIIRPDTKQNPLEGGLVA